MGRRAWQLSAVAGVLLLAVGCRGSQTPGETQSTGKALFAINCSTCHGPAGKGLGVYPKLVGVADILGGDYARTVIAEGRNNMPSFVAKLTPQQINEIVDYIATFKD